MNPNLQPAQFSEHPDLPVIDALLDRQRYWHGSRSKLDVGDELRPGSEVGIARHTLGESLAGHGEHVYMSRSIVGASHFAGPTHEEPHGYLYEVEPVGDVSEGPMSHLLEGGEFRASRARVKQVMPHADVREALDVYSNFHPKVLQSTRDFYASPEGLERAPHAVMQRNQRRERGELE
jgi:Rifampin ADP-ribosyl transferase